MNKEKTSYDAFTKILHWGMALGFLFMMFTVAVRMTMKDTSLYDAIWPFHYQMGFMILFLGSIRLLWLLKRLATHSDPYTQFLAKIGHYAMYILMITIPSLALLRNYGAGRGFEIFSIQIFEANENREIEFLVNLGNNFHSILGFSLFVMIFGHVFATIRHHKKGDKVLNKIT